MTSAIWYKENLERAKAFAAAWYEINSEKKNVATAAWAKNNPDKHNALGAKYRAAKLQRTPPWLTKEHWDDIRYVFSVAKELEKFSEESLEIDHIIPLQGGNVSGLHVPWNLQILTSSENASKGNKF